jgi:hypothetical protein
LNGSTFGRHFSRHAASLFSCIRENASHHVPKLGCAGCSTSKHDLLEVIWTYSRFFHYFLNQLPGFVNEWLQYLVKLLSRQLELKFGASCINREFYLWLLVKWNPCLFAS